VAVKLMPLTLASKPLLRARFLHEGAILARLKHPNVIRLLDQGEHEGILFMALEYISGYDLRQRLSESGPIPLQDLLPYLRQLAEALDYIHSEGIVHRDVKPANVILQVEEDGPVRRVVLGDFGIARDLSEEIDPFPSDIVGTLDYIAPEQIQAVGDIDRRADIYALGVMTFELLTGRLPFQKTHPGALILAHLREPAPDPLEINPALTPSAGAAIMRAMIKEREARYVSASDFVEALGRE
jgi:serine/threonine-protein kinase